MKPVLKRLMVVLYALISGCSLAPVYHQPNMQIPAHYKEATAWVKVRPSLAQASGHRRWWTVFGDPSLNQLEDQLTRCNPTLKIALSRFDESRALVEAARSQQYPTLLGLGGQSKQKNSQTVANNSNQGTFIYNTLTLQGFLTYEIDAWGAIRNTVSASAHASRASEFDLAAIDLSLHAMLANTYFELKGANAAQIMLDRDVKAFEHALYLIHQLHVGGAKSELAEDQAVNQLDNAKTAALNIRLKRATLTHAIAVLVGDVPAHFKLPPMNTPIRFVAVSPSIPSLLLQQRPDIAAAAERMQSANALIGVARAAFLPTLNVSSLIGYQGQGLGSLITSPSLIWALGPPSGLNPLPPEVSQVIFDGYLLQANLRHAKAGYYQTVNSYQQTVLQAFQDVEDGLVSTRRLAQEIETQKHALHAAHRALFQARQRMKEGMDTYLGVVDIENEYLYSELALIDLQTRAQMAAVNLIRALGGGWKIKQALKQAI